MNSELQFDHKIWDSISEEAKEFIEMALIKDSKDRWDARQLLNHSWLVK